MRPARGRALADRPDVRVGGAAPLVDQDPAALGEVEPGRPGQRVAGADAGGEDDDLRVDRVRVLEREPGDPAVLAEHLAGRGARVDGEPELLDVPAQGRATGVVDLHRHQPRRHLDHVGLEAELRQRVGGLETRAARRRSRRRRSRRPPPPGSPPGPRWSGRRSSRPGRGRAPAARTARRRWRAPARRRPAPRRRPAARCGSPGRTPSTATPRRSRTRGSSYRPSGRSDSCVGADLEEGGERDPVVRRSRLLADDHDVVGLGEAALDRGLHEAVADHAVADDDQGLAEVGAHERVPSRVGPSDGRCARSWRTAGAQPPQPVVARVVSRTSAREPQARIRAGA